MVFIVPPKNSEGFFNAPRPFLSPLDAAEQSQHSIFGGYNDFVIILCVIGLMIVIPWAAVILLQKRPAQNKKNKHMQKIRENISPQESTALRKQQKEEYIEDFIPMGLGIGAFVCFAWVLDISKGFGGTIDYRELFSLLLYFSVSGTVFILIYWMKLISRVIGKYGSFDAQKNFALWGLPIIGAVIFYTYTDFPDRFDDISKAGTVAFVLSCFSAVYLYLGWKK